MFLVGKRRSGCSAVLFHHATKGTGDSVSTNQSSEIRLLWTTIGQRTTPCVSYSAFVAASSSSVAVRYVRYLCLVWVTRARDSTMEVKQEVVDFGSEVVQVQSTMSSVRIQNALGEFHEVLVYQQETVPPSATPQLYVSWEISGLFRFLNCFDSCSIHVFQIIRVTEDKLDGVFRSHGDFTSYRHKMQFSTTLKGLPFNLQ